MPLEDELCDILKKARTGQSLSVSEVARAAGVTESDLTALERGEVPRDRALVRAVAIALGLRPGPLEQIAMDRWEPTPQPPDTGIDTIQGSVGGYGVQGYVVYDGGEALVIDTAYNAPAMIEWLAHHHVRLVGICLTHGHSDHAEGIEQILTKHEAPVYLGAEDVALLDWQPPARLLRAPQDGHVVPVGRRRLICLRTPGHTPGGICYQLDDPKRPICFVGDTLFAGSIGRSNPSALYQTHLGSVRERVLELAPATRLLPGHGPATTVAEEQTHNPFGKAA